MHRSPLSRLITVVLAILVVIIALPNRWKEQSWFPAILRPDFHFGLDLAGGTQLDFRISETEMQNQLTLIAEDVVKAQAAGDTQKVLQLEQEKRIIEQQQTTIVEAIRTVLERRINSLGVSEATITPSFVGSEKHLLVECPGIVDTKVCIETVGKTIQLEFKEEQKEATPEFEQSVRTKVKEAVARLQGSGASLATIGQDMSTQLGVKYQPHAVLFRDQLPKGMEQAWDVRPGIVRQFEATVETTVQDENGQPQPTTERGVFLVETLGPRTLTGRILSQAEDAFLELARRDSTHLSVKTVPERIVDESLPAQLVAALQQMKPGELRAVASGSGSADVVFLSSQKPGQVQADIRHLLIAYKGAQDADPSITRTREQALAMIKDLRAKVVAGADFATVIRAQSDGPSRSAGGLMKAVPRGSLVPTFESVAFSQAIGVISEPVETPFGYHLIRTEKTPAQSPLRASYYLLTVRGERALERAQGFVTALQNGEVQRQEESLSLRTLFFSLAPTGWKDTTLDGKHFRAASVVMSQTTNQPEVQIVFDARGAELFAELTKRNIGSRIAIFVGGSPVTAPRVNSEITGGSAVIQGDFTIEEAQRLAQDLNTGAIPAPIYLSGQRTVEATLGQEALAMSVRAGLWGILFVMLYMLLIYRFLGLLADAMLLIYSAIFLALMKLPLLLVTDQYIVLTLAGAAGLILSMGMSVDTNVLVFERIKEELRRGKLLKTAVELGFDKAWPSIRDSNISTLITCALLFMIGTSMVRGFAVTLGLGVAISMFTGMIVTRWLCRQVARTKIAELRGIFPGGSSSAA